MLFWVSFYFKIVACLKYLIFFLVYSLFYITFVITFLESENLKRLIPNAHE